jgi:hypothetical protein
MDFDRPLHSDSKPRPQAQTGGGALVEHWLDFLMIERETTIQRLRALDDLLYKHGRIKTLTLPRRLR